MDHKTERLEGNVLCLLMYSQNLPRNTDENHDNLRMLRLPLILYILTAVPFDLET